MLQHTPPRRSPRLKGDSVTSEPMDKSSAASGARNTTQAKDANSSGGQKMPPVPTVQTQPAFIDVAKVDTTATQQLLNRHHPRQSHQLFPKQVHLHSRPIILQQPIYWKCKSRYPCYNTSFPMPR